jgi:ABC-type transport system involved in Fe-S cluster assembly fused permease/ATPase subunit
VYTPLNSIGDYYKRVHQATVDMENMFDILEEQPEVFDAPDAQPLAVTGGRIEFKSVDFSYIPDRPLLRNLSWSIEAGKTVAIVGQSGAGKSTILRLLLRFL